MSKDVPCLACSFANQRGNAFSGKAPRTTHIVNFGYLCIVQASRYFRITTGKGALGGDFVGLRYLTTGQYFPCLWTVTNAPELLTRYAVTTRSHYVHLFSAADRSPHTADSRKVPDKVCAIGDLLTKAQ